MLLTAGAAEGFVLLAQALRGLRRPVVVHPQFTEPEAALRAAGHTVERVLLDAADGFRLHPDRIPADADLVMIGNPTNPTSVLHPAVDLAALARPGRVLVIDEAFADTTATPGVPGEPESLAARRDLPGLVVVRSLTKTWGLAGLRIGYLLGEAALMRRLAAVQPLWAVSTPALAAAAPAPAPRRPGPNAPSPRNSRPTANTWSRGCRPCPGYAWPADRQAPSCWCGSPAPTGSGTCCEGAAGRYAGATRFRGSAPTGCGSQFGIG
ncbi:hypothetical protein GCM10029963_61540 [Micromonospora andamanensis]